MKILLDTNVLLDVLADGSKEFVVLHVPDRLVRWTDRQVGQVGNQLSKADVWRELAQLDLGSEDLLAERVRLRCLRGQVRPHQAALPLRGGVVAEALVDLGPQEVSQRGGS